MATNTPKKKTTTKKTTTKKTTKGKNTPTSRLSKAKKQEIARRQFWAIILFAIGLLCASLTLIEGNYVWKWMHNVIFGFFGWSAYLMSPILIYIAVMETLDKPIGNPKNKLWQTIILVILISGLTQIVGAGMPVSEGLYNKFLELFNNGISLKGGGISSLVIGLPLHALFGKVGASITIIIFIFVFILIVTGTTLRMFFSIATKPVKKIEKAYNEKVSFREEIEDDIDELPPHPVITSPRGTIKDDSNVKLRRKETLKAKDKLLSILSSAKIKEEKKFFAPEAMEPTFDDDVKQNIKENIQKINEQKNCEAINTDKITSIDELVKKAQQPEDKTDYNQFNFDEKEPTATLIQTDEEIADVPVITPVEDKTEEIPQQNQIVEPSEEIKEEVQDKKDDEIKEVPLFDIDPYEQLPKKLEAQQIISYDYAFPPTVLLTENKIIQDNSITEELKENAEKLIDTLKSFGVGARIINISKGPAVTRYELQPSAGVKISKITNLADDIALNLAAAGVRIEAPIPNKPAIGIEVPNKKVDIVSIREIIDSTEFNDAKSKLSVALGKDIAGNIALADIAKMPHILIAGATGSGKSVCINSIITSILYKASPDEVKLLMVDPKVVELGTYNGIPHLLVPVVTDPKKAAGALAWAVTEMLNRYKTFASNNVRDLKGYNKLTKIKTELEPMPQIVIIIDELADLMMACPNEVEDSICRLAQMARAAGMHLVIATQRPSVDVITGVIKANIPSRIAFSVSSQVDSRTILDGSGAEKLLGRGDMLFYPVGASKPLRVQGCFVSDEEVEKVVSYIKNGGEEAIYDETIIEEIEKQAVSNDKAKGKGSSNDIEDDHDDMFDDAVECVIKAGQASTSMLQRKLKLGYARAARIMDEMEEEGYIGEFCGSKPREVVITREQWLERKLRNGNEEV